MDTPRSDTIMRLGLVNYNTKIINKGDGIRLENIWAIYKLGLLVDLVYSSRQHVTIIVNGTLMTFVHSNYNTIERRALYGF